MALSREEIAAAEKMHRFVQSWEKHHPSALRSMWIFLPISLSSVLQTFRERTHTYGYVFLGIWLVMMVAFFFIDRFQRARYARERLIVQALERDHAEELPWIPEARLEEQVKEHLAAVQQIQRELAHGRA
jgi:hypothetical protein